MSFSKYQSSSNHNISWNIFKDYEETVEKSLQSYDPKCVESITNAIKQIVGLIDDTENVKNNLEIFQ